jgi:hypothetical protein
MKKQWYLQRATDEENPDPFWDSYVHKMCEVLETTDKSPFGKPIKEFKKNKKDRKYFLDEAEKLINGPRAKEYGDASLNHQRIADMWSVIFGIKVTVSMVYLAMIALKMSRIMNTPDHEDSWVDICGYGALGAEENNDE